MSDYTQVKSTLISHQAVTHPNSVQGTPVSVASSISCLIVMWHALIEAAANTNPGKFRIFGSLDSTGDDAWFHILDVEVTNATPATETLSGSEAVGSKVLEVASTTGITAADNVYVQDTGTETDSEWHTVDKIVSNVSIDLMIGLANAKDSADVIWGSAQQFAVPLDCSGLSRIRVDFSHEGAAGANAAVKAEVLTGTDIE